jgi:hypothetical protein
MADEIKSFKVQVTTVITTNKEGSELVKTRANGDSAPYALCGVRFLDGPLKGKSTWAQRTLLNREGIIKENVAKGDEVFVIASVYDNKPFFEISTSVNATDSEMLAMLGLVAPEVTPVHVDAQPAITA